MGWDGMGWDGMGWDGVGWGGVGWGAGNAGGCTHKHSSQIQHSNKWKRTPLGTLLGHTTKVGPR